MLASDYVSGGWLSCGLVLVVLLLPPVVRLSFFLGSCLACVAFAPPSWASGPQVYVCCCHPVPGSCCRAAGSLVLLPLAGSGSRCIRCSSGLTPPSGCRCSHSPCPCPALHWLGQRSPNPLHHVGRLCPWFALVLRAPRQCLCRGLPGPLHFLLQPVHPPNGWVCVFGLGWLSCPPSARRCSFRTLLFGLGFRLSHRRGSPRAAAHSLSFPLGLQLPPNAAGFGKQLVDLVWEADHIAAGFLRDVGEVLVDDLRELVRFSPRLASCFMSLYMGCCQNACSRN